MEVKNSYKEHFERELEIIKKEYGDDLSIKDYIDVIKQITEIFNDQGHSGYSAHAYANMLSQTIKNILLFKPFSPLTGEDDEWTQIGEDMDFNGQMNFQNKRNSAVFKRADGTAYFIDAIVWREPDGSCFSTKQVEGFKSIRNLKFPIIPKTFYVDVKGDINGKYIIMNQYQLKEVMEYYK